MTNRFSIHDADGKYQGVILSSAPREAVRAVAALALGPGVQVVDEGPDAPGAPDNE